MIWNINFGLPLFLLGFLIGGLSVRYMAVRGINSVVRRSNDTKRIARHYLDIIEGRTGH